jgi:predicted RNase H-like HicB family nuclease
MALELLDPEVTGNLALSVVDNAEWKQNQFRCLVSFIPEEDGTWSAVVLNLPGAGSCGQTKEEALENVREAIAGLLESYAEDGTSPPWSDPASEDIPDNSKFAWIVVNA